MRAKTIFIIIVTVLITVFLMVNTDPVDFNFLVAEVAVSKLIVIGFCTILGFALGFLAGRPKTTVTSYDDSFEADDDVKNPGNRDTLSKEDRDYIS